MNIRPVYNLLAQVEADTQELLQKDENQILIVDFMVSFALLVLIIYVLYMIVRNLKKGHFMSNRKEH